MQHVLVILADQHPSMLDGIRRMLEREVKSVVMVADEVSLMQAVGRTSPDLVIADLSLPVSRTANVAQLLKRHSPDLRVIITSVHDEGAVLEEVMTAGVEGFVLQRRIAIDLLPALHEVMQGRRYVSPDVEQWERWYTADPTEISEYGSKT